MRIVRLSGLLGCLILAACAFAEVQVINGRKYECRDGLCYLVEESGDAASRPLQSKGEPSVNVGGQETASPLPRIAQGYMRAEEFVAFLEGKEADSLAGHGLWVMLLNQSFHFHGGNLNTLFGQQFTGTVQCNAHLVFAEEFFGELC